MAKTTKVCLDKVIPQELEEVAQNLSIAENPANKPRRTAFELAAVTGWLWRPGSTLNVRFLGGTPRIRERVEFYAHQWEKFANIKFKFISSGRAHIRVAFINGDGSWSYLGTQALLIGDQQMPTMNYGWLRSNTSEDEYSRVVLHEFGHALGCIHEHQHPEHGIPWDKEKAYAHYGRQGWTRDEVDQQVFGKYSTTVTQFSGFDTNSIMMYPIPEDITIGDFAVGWNRKLSDTDKEFIARLYPAT
jgi:serralysin